MQITFIKLLSSFIASAFFGVVVNVPRRILFQCGLTGMFGWTATQIFIMMDMSQVSATFLGAVVVSIFSIYYAKRTRVPATAYNLTGFFPLVPGVAAYQSMNAFIKSEFVLGISLLIKTFTISVTIALAIVLVEIIYRVYMHRKQRRISRKTLLK